MESKNESSREEWGLRETDDKQSYQQATQFPATYSAMSVKAMCVSVICMCTHTSTNQTGERARGLLSLKPLELNGFNQQVDKLYPPSFAQVPPSALGSVLGRDGWQCQAWPSPGSQQARTAPCHPELPPLPTEGILLAAVQLLSQSCLNSFPILTQVYV